MQSLKNGKRLSKAFWAGQRYHHGQTCGQSFVRRKSRDSRGKAVEADQPEWRKKKRMMQRFHRRNKISKVRCFNCGELGHFFSTCPKKKDKGASDSKAAVAKDDGYCASFAFTFEIFFKNTKKIYMLEKVKFCMSKKNFDLYVGTLTLHDEMWSWVESVSFTCIIVQILPRSNCNMGAQIVLDLYQGVPQQAVSLNPLTCKLTIDINCGKTLFKFQKHHLSSPTSGFRFQ